MGGHVNSSRKNAGAAHGETILQPLRASQGRRDRDRRERRFPTMPRPCPLTSRQFAAMVSGGRIAAGPALGPCRHSERSRALCRVPVPGFYVESSSCTKKPQPRLGLASKSTHWMGGGGGTGGHEASSCWSVPSRKGSKRIRKNRSAFHPPRRPRARASGSGEWLQRTVHRVRTVRMPELMGNHGLGADHKLLAPILPTWLTDRNGAGHRCPDRFRFSDRMTGSAACRRRPDRQHIRAGQEAGRQHIRAGQEAGRQHTRAGRRDCQAEAPNIRGRLAPVGRYSRRHAPPHHRPAGTPNNSRARKPAADSLRRQHSQGAARQ